MAYYDRAYYRDDYRGPGGGGGFGFGRRLSMHSVVTWLIIINAVVFLLDMILTGSTRADALSPSYWGNYNVDQGLLGGQFWRFVTYQFLHAGFFHIFFNLLVLYFFGPMVESWLGSKRFIGFYLTCGVGGAVLYTVLAFAAPGLFPQGEMARYQGMVGASGCIFGVLVAAARVAPNQTVMLLIPPIPMKMKTLVYVLLGMNVLMVLVGARNTGGSVAHLGGAAVGFLLMLRPGVLNIFEGRLFREIGESVAEQRRERQQKQQRAADEEIDRILLKVHREGLQSLNRQERRTLQQATESKRGR